MGSDTPSPRPSPHVLSRQLGQSCVLVDLDGQQLFELNPTGARIWELLLEEIPRDELERRLAEEFAVDPGELHEAVERLLGELSEAGLLIQSPATTSGSVAVAVDRDDGVQLSGHGADQPWVVRWNPQREPAPTVSGGSGRDIHRAPDGSWTLFCGYLFGVERGRCAAHVARGCADGGDRFVDALRGAFVVVTWQPAQRRLTVWRDGLGIQPCYYARSGGELWLSCSVDALLAQPGVDPDFNRPLVAEYLYGQITARWVEETFYRHVLRIPPAHRLTASAAAFRLERYWDPLPAGFEWAAPDEVEQLETRLESAVERCIAAGANAIALSGGFDSVAIAALAAPRCRAESRPLHALSIRMVDTDWDEGLVQRRVAEALGLELQLQELPPRQMRDDFIERALAPSAELPVPVLSLWQWLLDALLERASETGCSRVMTGSGGDEMFIVDPRYAEDLFDARAWSELGRFCAAWVRSSQLPAARVLTELLWRSMLRPKLVRTTSVGIGRVARRWLAGARRAAAGTVQLAPPDELRAELRARQARPERDIAAERGGPRAYRQVLRELLQAPLLTLEFDQAAAWAAPHGIDFLYPYYDRDLVELALRVAPEQLYRSGRMKRPLRDLVRRRLPAVSMPKRKVDFTLLGGKILRDSGARTWRAFGGAKRLDALGIVDRRAAEAWMRRFVAGQHQAVSQVWRLIGVEAWLRARERGGSLGG